MSSMFRVFRATVVGALCATCGRYLPTYHEVTFIVQRYYTGTSLARLAGTVDGF